MFMGVWVVAPIDGVHTLGIEHKAAHQIGGAVFALHDAAAARFYGAFKTVVGG